jgi:dUTP pyrophosphatase
MEFKLKILPTNDYTKIIYSNHQFFNNGDSGLDLFCPETITIQPGETIVIDLKIQCKMINIIQLNNLSYFIYPRSSMGLRTPIRLANSVEIIDAGYRGNLFTIVDNIKNEAYTINQGDRLFQICAPNLSPFYFEIVNALTESQRGLTV